MGSLNNQMQTGMDWATGKTTSNFGIPAGYRTLANDLWGKSQEGMGQSQQYLNPAWNYANQYAQNAGPGAFEQTWGGLADQLKGPSGAQEVYAQYQPPGAMRDAYGQSQGFFQQPGMGQGLADQFTGQMQAPGTGEGWFQAQQGAWNMPGASEDLSKYTGSQNKMDQMFADQLAQKARLSGSSATERASGEIGGLYREAGGLARTAGQTEAFAGRQLPGLEQRGLHEQFVGSAMSGQNPYIDMLEQEGAAKLNQELARRGHFDSGGANVALGKFMGQMGAERFRDLAGLTQSAQQMGLQRTQAGQGLAQASDTGRLARGQGIQSSGGSLQSLSGQMDQERMAREALSAQISQQMMGGAQSDRDFDLRARTQADRARLDRLMGGGDQAFRAQDAAEGRMLGAYGMGNQQDQYNLTRTMQGLNAANMYDQNQLADFAMRSQLAGQMDDTTFRRIMAQGDLAGQAQNFGRQRDLDIYGMLSGAGGAQAGNVRDWYGLGMGAYGQAQSDALNAQMDMYLADRMAQEQAAAGGGGWGFWGGLAGAGIGGFLGGPAGAAAGYGIGRGAGGYVDERRR